MKPTLILCLLAPLGWTEPNWPVPQPNWCGQYWRQVNGEGVTGYALCNSEDYDDAPMGGELIGEQK